MNPYADTPDAPITSMTDLFGAYRLVPTKKHQSERGELLRYFAQKTERPISYIAMRLTKMDMPTLYHIKASADGYEREGKGAWAKAFFGMLKVRP